MDALRPFNLAAGDYGMPCPPRMTAMGSPEFQAKMKAGPVGIHDRRGRRHVQHGRTWSSGSSTRWSSSVFAAYVAGVALGPGTDYLSVPGRRLRGVHRLRAWRAAQSSIWWGRSWGSTIRGMSTA